jgi:lactocepin
VAKKSFAILLILLLTVSNVALGALPAKQQKPSSEGPKSISEDQGQYDDNDKVRVIVELEGETGIEYATKKNKKYKDLDESTKNELQEKALDSQKDVKNELSNAKVDAKYLNSFTTVVNGFSAEVDYGKVDLIKNQNNVEDVHIVHEYKRPTQKPEMVYSKELVQAQKAWRDYGLKGQGMVVGVIDTGIDPGHRDMVLSSDTEVKFTEDDIKEAVSSNELPGKYYTEKVPYGYNYMDQNNEIRDLGAEASMHGMHVSGTVGANGDEENGGIKGVAPEAQLLALKVFGNDPEMPSTWSDIYVKAIDDAIALGADVLNMSLGSTAAFVSPEDPEQKAVERAVENGVLMSISAGNSGHFGNGYYNPDASNPDIGVVGSPGISTNSLQVASLENTTISVEGMEVFIDGESIGNVGYQKQDSPNFLDLFKDEKKEVVYVGTGEESFYEGKDVEGKIVFAVRTGSYYYSEIQKTAETHGAAGVIVRGAPAHGDYVSMALESPTIPLVSLSVSDGTALELLVQDGKSMEVVFNNSKVAATNPEADKMSTFTSWGVTPNLDFKPEITAPGGKIYSTLNDDQYGTMSGTSMAAPHVAGGAALVLQRVDEEFSLSGADRVNMAKNIMMNTSVPVTDKSLVNATLGWENPYSPRRQGAGIMQLHSAISTPIVVTDSESGLGKVSLKEVTDSVNFSLNVENFSDEAANYDIAANVQTDLALGGYLGYPGSNELESQEILDAVVTTTVDGEEVSTLDVPANSTVKVDVAIDLSEAKVLEDDMETLVAIDDVFENGYFVEGFVTLTSENQHVASVPYVGFNGEWDKAPILDAPAGDVDNTFYGYTGLAANFGSSLNFLGGAKINSDLVAFSPNGDGNADTAVPILSFLRNAKKVEYNVLDSEGNELRTIRTENNVRKNYYDGNAAPMYSIKTTSEWDGKVKLKSVEEGDYIYEVKALLDYPDAEWQTFQFPVIVDVTAPTFNVEYDEETNELNFKDVKDSGVGVEGFDVQVNGTSVLEAPLAGDSVSYSLETPTDEIDYLDVYAVDYAGNATSIRVPNVGDSTIPDVHWLTPGALGVVDTKEPVVTGYINEDSGIKELKIDGKTVEVVWNEAEKRYDFETTLSFDNDGVKIVGISVVDGNGNNIEFERRFFVDSTSPTLEVIGAPAKAGVSQDSVNVSVKVADNFDEIRLLQDGDEIFYNEMTEPYEMVQYEKTIEDIELPLVVGENTFTFQVTDLAGHEVTKEVVITKEDAQTPDPGPVDPDPVDPEPSEPTDPTPPSDKDTVVVDESAIKEALNNSSDKEIVVELPASEKSNATIEKKALEKVVESKKSLKLATGEASLVLPAKVVAGLSKDSDENVTISLNQVAAADVPVDKENLKSKVFDFTVTVDGEKVSEFDEAIKVQLSVKGKTFKDKRKVSAYYLNEDTNKWEYVGGLLKDDNFVFTTSHFSKYTVIENDISFKDIQDHWAQDEIEVLASRTITQGKSENSFAPQQKLTRAEFAVLLAKTLKLPTNSYEGVFKDVKEYKEWAYAGIEAAYHAGIVKGSLDGYYNPDAQITREEMATMIVRAVKYQDKSLLEDLAPSNKFKDDSRIGAFAKESVYLANELGIIKGRSDNSFDPKNDTTRAETAVMLYRMLNTLGEM